MMKKVVTILILVVLLAVPSSAHSGGTDSNGGHNSPTGYHYHHGYPAHQHIDGVCELKVAQDKESQKALNLIKVASERKDLKIEQLEKKTSELEALQEQTEIWRNIAIGMSVGMLFLLCILLKRQSSAYKLSMKEQEHNQIFALAREKKTHEEEVGILQHNIQALRADYQKTVQFLLTDAPLAEAPIPIPENLTRKKIELPKGTILDASCRPVEKDTPGKWGEKYTFYVSSSGKTYHGKPECRNISLTPIHALGIPSDFKPCTRCGRSLPDLQWYYDYIKRQDISAQWAQPQADEQP